MTTKSILRLGLPKGSLQDATIEKMAKAGYNIQVSSRSYIPYVDDPELEVRLIRAQEVSRYVEHGYLIAASPATIGCRKMGPTFTRSASSFSVKPPAKPLAGCSPCPRTRK